MGAAVGQSLPIAVGVMISPLPIVAVVLMLLSGKARANAIAFVVTWFLAVGTVVFVVAVLAGASTPDDAPPPTWVGWTKIVLGLLLLLLAGRQWRARPRAGTEASSPRWMAAMDAFTPVKAAGLAVLLGAVNPKNLLLAASGGATIGAAAPGETGTVLVAAAVFAAVASLGVAAPLVIYVSAKQRATHLLDELKAWLIMHNAVIMATILVILGVKLVGDGIAVL